MRNKSLKEKFARGVNYVKPLYRKVTFRNKSLSVDVESNVKLEGSDIDVNKCQGFTVKTVLFKNNDADKRGLPGLCQIEESLKATPNHRSDIVSDGSWTKPKVSNTRMMAVVDSSIPNDVDDSAVLQETNAQGGREVVAQVGHI